VGQLAIGGNVFTADICQIAERFEPQAHELFVQRVEFAHRRNVEQHSTEAANIPFKGALGRNQATEEMRRFRVLDFEIV
jgi:hypothetical protein